MHGACHELQAFVCNVMNAGLPLYDVRVDCVLNISKLTWILSTWSLDNNTVYIIIIFFPLFFFFFVCFVLFFLFRSGQNHLAKHSERWKKTRQTEKEVGRHHQEMDRPRVRSFSEGSEKQREI